MMSPPDAWEIAIRIESHHWNGDDAVIAERAAIAALATGFRDDAPLELSILLADDEFVRHLNKRYRNKDHATNVLSFESGDRPMPGAPDILGDVILARETCESEAEDSETPFWDHLAHLVVHGVLHLLGYDHLEATEAESMERLEITILHGLGIPNPYADTEPVSHDTGAPDLRRQRMRQ